MRIKIRLKIMMVGVFVVLFGVLGYLLLFGKLFPYSPIIIGFSKHELSNTRIYVQNGAGFKDYQKIDALIPPVEAFHQLKFLKKPEIFIFRNSSSYIQRAPSNVRFCTFYNSRVFTTPWALEEAREGKISMEIYLRHELSHSLLYQHSGIINAYKYPAWLIEGIAVYSSNLMGTSYYPSKEETYNLMRKGNFFPPDLYKTNKEDQIKLKVEYRKPFMYSEFACIVEYLIKTEGKDKFLLYMKGFLKDANHDKVFKGIYGIDFEKFILNFKKSIMNGHSRPSSNRGKRYRSMHILFGFLTGSSCGYTTW